MKESRFIELVNLYIDRQISAEETAELEAELQQSAKHRAIYRQYCRMHAATKQAYESFRTHADEPAAGRPAGERVAFADFKRRSRGHWIHYAGGLAAAACLAVAFVRYNAAPQAAVESPVAKLEAAAPAVQVAAAQPAPVNPVAVASAPAAVPASLRHPLATEPDYAAMLAALRREEQRAFANGEIQGARLPASLFDDGVFDTQRYQGLGNQRSFRGKQAPAQQAEFTAFQFQR